MSAPADIGVPDWAFDAVWYQIFPERFRNGDPRNNPQPEDLGEECGPEDWSITPWGSDWYASADWEKTPSSVFRRRYGGDLVGLRGQLDYLQDLGVNALYLNPIFQSPSLHKYDAVLLHHVDPALGPDRAGDLKALRDADETEDPATWIWTAADRYFVDLVADVHRRGMRIIIDGVFNHTGRGFFAFRDLLKQGKDSAYRDWYRIRKWKKDGTFNYKGWFEHASLPEFARPNGTLSAPVQEYLFNITRRWMDPDGDGDPSDGIDGWRLDVAFCVPDAFWRAWRHEVKAINPQAYLTAEIVRTAGKYLRGDMFDAVMNYAWLYPVVEFFSPGSSPLPSAELRRKLSRIRRSYPRDVNHVVQNLLDSHDVARIATVLENPALPKSNWEDYFDAARTNASPSMVTTKPGKSAFAALRQLVVFQVTYPGAPMIYYGAEVGMWGANDPDNRQPMLWGDIAYDPERRDHRGAVPASQRAPDEDLRAFYQRAFALRAAHAVFRRGDFKWLRTAQDRLLAYERRYQGERMVVVLNASDVDLTYRLRVTGQDLWNAGAVVTCGPLAIPPRGWRILRL